MKEHVGKAVGISAIGFGLLAFMIAAPSTSPLYGRTTNDNAAVDPNDQSASGNQGSQGQQTTQSQQGQQGQSAGGLQADVVINAWNTEPQQAARKLIDKYGQPTVALDDRLIWIGNGQFKHTIVYRDPVEHNFPSRHMDLVEQAISYKVPVNKVGDLSRFDGGLSVNRTKGLLTSFCKDETMNILSLNLANDIVRGKKSVDEARSFSSKTSQLTLSGKSSPYTESLEFSIDDSNVGDADKVSGAKNGSSSSKSGSSTSGSSSDSSGISPDSSKDSSVPSSDQGTQKTPQNKRK
jgi:hypothetical protein